MNLLVFVLLYGSAAESKFRKCSMYREQTSHIIEEGWPLSLNCHQPFIGYYHGYATSLNKSIEGVKLECIFVDVDNEKVVQRTYLNSEECLTPKLCTEFVVTKITSASSKNYQVIVKSASDENEKCASLEASVNVQKFTPVTCEQSRGHVIKEYAYYGESKSLHCYVPHESPKKESRAVHGDTKLENFSVHWYRECNSSGIRTDDSEIFDREMIIRNMTQAGAYTCAIEYNGMTKYVVTYDICLIHKNNLPTAINLVCPKGAVEANLGERAVLSGKFQSGVGSFSIISHVMSWDFKQESDEEETVCEMHNLNNRGTSRKSERFQCQTYDDTFNSLNRTCKELNIKKVNEVKSHLVIRSVKQQDYGTYTYKLQIEGHDVTNCHVTLRPRSHRVAVLVIGLFVSLLGISLFAVAVNHFKIYIRVFVRRKFTPKCAKRVCSVCLSYYYSSKMTREDQDLTKECVETVERILRKLGCTIYDEHRDAQLSQYTAKSIEEAIGCCDRVAILLTSSDFINEPTALFRFQKYFEKAMETKTKLILVLGPKMKSFICEAAKSNKTCELIKKTIKNNGYIKWDETKSGDTKFKLEIECAIPRLKFSSTNKAAFDV